MSMQAQAERERQARVILGDSERQVAEMFGEAAKTYIDTRNWWPGRRVVISPQWIDRVSWTESKIFVNVARDRVRLSPEYIEQSVVTRDDEAELYGHYKRAGYWREKLTAGQPLVVEGRDTTVF